MRNLARSDAMASLAEVVNSPLISTLITQETEVKRKMAQLSQEYGSRHPVLINAKAELQDLRAKIDAHDALRAQQPDVTLISYAPIPSEPSFPRRLLLVALAAVVSGLIAVVLVLIIEQLDVGFRSSEQLEQAFGIPVLGSVPDLERPRRHKKRRVARYVLEQPTSSFAEA